MSFMAIIELINALVSMLSQKELKIVMDIVNGNSNLRLNPRIANNSC